MRAAKIDRLFSSTRQTHAPLVRIVDPADLRVFPKGRVCRSEGCQTILCIYNPGPTCWPCGPAGDELRGDVFAVKERAAIRAASDQLDEELEELMVA